MRPDFVDGVLDFFRFTEEKYRLEKEQKDKEMLESMARLMDNPHSQNTQCIDVDLGIFKKR